MPDLIQKVEEKVSWLLKEIEGMRKEIIVLRQENFILKNSHGQSTEHLQKLQNLVSLLDVMDTENELVTY